MTPAIHVQGLVKKYEDVVAVDGLDLEVRAGECFGLLGPNGAGKTTTCEILEGVLEPTAGVVEVLGQKWGTRHDRELRERLGVCLQETRLSERLTVEETLTMFRSFYRRGHPVEEVLARVELGEKRTAQVHKLSGGQRQRLAVACALVSDPEILFLDEPTTGLDPQSRRHIWDLVVEFKRGGRTVLLTTHYMEEAERLCDRVAIVDHGKVIALGTPAELIDSLGAQHVVELAVEPDGLDVQSLAGLESVVHARPQAGGFALTVRQPHLALPAILAQVSAGGRQLTRLSTHHATLEDVFVSMTGRTLRE